MANQNVANLTNHLLQLLKPTKSNIDKLIAAWDGLSVESQIFLLEELGKANLPTYLNNKIGIKALESTNSYVRYLGARGLHLGSGSDLDEAENAAKQKIEADPDPLVKYSLLEHDSLFMESPERFCNLPHEARLARIRSMVGQGKEFAEIISHIIENQLKTGSISEIEVYEMLSEYVTGKWFKRIYCRDYIVEDFLEYGSLTEDIKALWNLVLRLPVGVSRIFIESLPPIDGDLVPIGNPRGVMRETDASDILESLSDYQLAWLLRRQDIRLRDFREKLFHDVDNKPEFVREAAASYYFNLKDDDFTRILNKPEIEKKGELRFLSWGAKDLRLCIYEAIGDVLHWTTLFDTGLSAKERFNEKIVRFQGAPSGLELQEVRLYRLAKMAVPWNQDEEGALPEEFEFLREEMVKGDTWATFIAFSKVKKDRQKDFTWSAHLEKTLEDIFPVEGVRPHVEESDLTDLAIEENITEILSTLSNYTDEEKTKLAKAFTQLTILVQEKTTRRLDDMMEDVDDLKREMGNRAIEAIEMRNRFIGTRFFYALLIGLLIWIIIIVK